MNQQYITINGDEYLLIPISIEADLEWARPPGSVKYSQFKFDFITLLDKLVLEAVEKCEREGMIIAREIDPWIETECDSGGCNQIKIIVFRIETSVERRIRLKQETKNYSCHICAAVEEGEGELDLAFIKASKEGLASMIHDDSLVENTVDTPPEPDMLHCVREFTNSFKEKK